MEKQYTELYEKLSRLQWLLHRHHLQNHAQHGPMADPTRGQGRVLAMLKLQSQISSKDLAYLLGIRQQSLNELLSKLEKNGYISRVPSEKDRRVMMISLTEKGKDARQEDKEPSGIFDCLQAEEQEKFGDYLDRVIAALEKEVRDESMQERWDAWSDDLRSRMSEEEFQHLMSRHRGGHPDRPGLQGFGFEGPFDRRAGGPFGKDSEPWGRPETPRPPHGPKRHDKNDY